MGKDLEKLDVVLVEPGLFKIVIDNVSKISDRYKQNLDVKDNYNDYDCYLAEDYRFGFCVHKKTGELCNVFSIEKGRGEEILSFATTVYRQLRLDCFDGYLKEFYSRFGFKEVKREENYTKGGPDVIFLEYLRVNEQESLIPRPVGCSEKKCVVM
jgi:hypothetical protein